jgi:hypothetical protein
MRFALTGKGALSGLEPQVPRHWVFPPLCHADSVIERSGVTPI